MKKRIVCTLLVFVMLLAMLPVKSLTADASTARVEALVKSMTLRNKITQMLMVDFRQWGNTAGTAADFTVMNDEVQKIVEDYHFGAVILFSNNAKQTEQIFHLTKALQSAATKDDGIPLIITCDQEGGSVYRLGSGTALSGNMALGATYLAYGTGYAKEAGEIIGSELSAVGINTNFAPVVDINNNPNNPVIGLRSFSDDPNIVGQMAAALVDGMEQYNVIGCAKHFPGHGDTGGDSHYDLPVVDKSLTILRNHELKPYELLIENGVDMIMTAHILYPQLESDKIFSSKTGQKEALPATMSDDILTKLLKKDMGFCGIVTTDAMNMAGVADKWDSTQSVVIAIQAGVDMICMPTRISCKSDLAVLDTIIDGVVDAVEDGTLSMSRINDAVTRILTVKENRGILDYNARSNTLAEANSTVGCAANREMEREMAAAAVTVVKNHNNTLPLKVTKNSKVLMLTPYDNECAQMIMAWNRARGAGLIPEGAKVDYCCFSSGSTIAAMQKKLDWADTYIIISEVSSTVRMGYKHWMSSVPNQLCDYAASQGKSAIVVSCDKPYDVQLYPNAGAILAAYGCKGSSVDPTEALIGGATGSDFAVGPNIIAAVEVALGTYGATGKLPLDIYKYDKSANTYTDTVLYPRGFGLTYSALVQRDLKGDMNTDGKVNIGDVARLYAHVERTKLLDSNVLSRGETNGDGKITIVDTARLYTHTQQTFPLS